MRRVRGCWCSQLIPDAIPTLRTQNPLVIPRNHLVEAAITSAVYEDDFEPFNLLLDGVTRPFDDQPATPSFIFPPKADQQVTRTFCGT